MTTARVVPVTTEMDGDELDAQDAWQLARRIGLRRLLLDSFLRFRYADGFSHSRALALQVALSVVPFLLALSGLAADIDQERPAKVLAQTVERLSPGGGSRDALAAAVGSGSTAEGAGDRAGGRAAGPGSEQDREPQGHPVEGDPGPPPDTLVRG